MSTKDTNERWDSTPDLLQEIHEFLRRGDELINELADRSPDVLNAEDKKLLRQVNDDVIRIKQMARRRMYAAAQALRLRVTPVADTLS